MQSIEQLEAEIRKAMEMGRWDTAEHFGRKLDAAQAREPRPTLLGAALWYAGVGLPVFPVFPAGTVARDGQPADKRPMVRSGCHAATCDPGRIGQWWAEFPAANIGLATGHLVDVIDIDGPEGLRSWLDIPSADAPPPAVGVVKTPRKGGFHVYVRVTGQGNRAGMLPGVDYRGQGGYVLAPPSQINTPAYAGSYRWRRPLDLTSPRPWPLTREEINQGESR